MAIPLVGLYTDNIPSRSEPLTFRVDGDNFNAYFGVIGVDINATATEMNNTAATIDADKIAAAASATAAEISANISAASANFQGVWADLTGAANKPFSVENAGGVWALNVDLADITTSEPGVTSDWTLVTGQKYVTPVAGATLSTVLINNLKTSDTFKYPIAANVQAGLSVTIAILETYKGITPQIDLQGGNSAKNSLTTVTDNVIYSAGFAGLDDAVSNGVDTWEF